MAPSGLYARLCHAFLVIYLLHDGLSAERWRWEVCLSTAVRLVKVIFLLSTML